MPAFPATLAKYGHAPLARPVEQALPDAIIVGGGLHDLYYVVHETISKHGRERMAMSWAAQRSRYVTSVELLASAMDNITCAVVDALRTNPGRGAATVDAAASTVPVGSSGGVGGGTGGGGGGGSGGGGDGSGAAAAAAPHVVYRTMPYPGGGDLGRWYMGGATCRFSNPGKAAVYDRIAAQVMSSAFRRGFTCADAAGGTVAARAGAAAAAGTAGAASAAASPAAPYHGGVLPHPEAAWAWLFDERRLAPHGGASTPTPDEAVVDHDHGLPPHGAGVAIQSDVDTITEAMDKQNTDDRTKLGSTATWRGRGSGAYVIGTRAAYSGISADLATPRRHPPWVDIPHDAPFSYLDVWGISAAFANVPGVSDERHGFHYNKGAPVQTSVIAAWLQLAAEIRRSRR